MGGHYITGRAASADWAWRLAAFSTLLVPLSILFFRLRLLDLPTLTWSLGLAMAGLALGLLFAVYAMARIWILGEDGGGRSLAALALALAAAAPFVFVAHLVSQAPLGNAARTAGFAAPGAFARSAETGSAVLPGRDFQAAASIVYGAARTALADEGMTVVDVSTPTTPLLGSDDLGVSGTVLVPVPTPRDSVDRERAYDPLSDLDSDDYTVTAVAFAPIFGFPSDVTVRIVEEEGETFVDVRSVSRTIANDGGLNRRIVEGFLESLEAAMNVLEGVTPEG